METLKNNWQGGYNGFNRKPQLKHDNVSTYYLKKSNCPKLVFDIGIPSSSLSSSLKSCITTSDWRSDVKKSVMSDMSGRLPILRAGDALIGLLVTRNGTFLLAAVDTVLCGATTAYRDKCYITWFVTMYLLFSKCHYGPC